MRRVPAVGTAAVLAAALAVVVPIVVPGPAAARSLFVTLFGESPDTTSRIERSADQGIDSLDVPGWADLGYVSLGDLVTRIAGGDAARLGMDVVVRPIDMGGAGRGRTSLLFNGLPAGDGVVHWDNYAWLPLRGLTTLGIEREPAARTDAAAALPGGRIVATTLVPGKEPLSTVALTGGAFGHRLAELDFSRTLGKYGLHIDGADFNHTGFGAFGEAHLSRGFGQLTLPLLGFRTAFDLAIAAGKVSSPGLADGGLEKTHEKRYALRLERGAGRNVTELSALRQVSRLETGAFSDVIPFALEDSRWRLGYRRTIPAGAGALGLDLAAARELRTGVLPKAGIFWSEEGALSYTRAAAGGFDYTARLGVARREPTGVTIEPGLRLSRETAGRLVWLDGGRSTGIPAILLNQDTAAPDVFGVQAILDGLEKLARPESHIGFEAGLVTGRRGSSRPAGRTAARQIGGISHAAEARGAGATGGAGGASAAGGAGDASAAGAGSASAAAGADSGPDSVTSVSPPPPQPEPSPEESGIPEAWRAGPPARIGFGIVAGANRTSDSPGFLSPSRDVLAFQPIADAYWTGRVDATAFWAPHRDLDFVVRGGYHFFDLARQPFEPNLTAEASLTLRRDFFEHDLHLSVTAGGELIGRRMTPDGQAYPATGTATITLTGRIKTLTLFWRIENPGGVYIESDLREQGTPVALPTLYSRIGATLRLVD